MTDPVAYPCGCVNQIDPPSGVLRSLSKCPSHLAMRQEADALGEAYYRGLGALDADAPERYAGQLAEALGPFPPAPARDAPALEVGCGASPYVGAVRAAGYHWVGCDPSAWVEWWVREQHDAYVSPLTLEQLATEEERGQWDLILCAHAFEHMPDAPGAIRQCADLLAPGGELWAVVPDDEDPCNPDHLFYFTAGTLRSCLERAGLVVEREATRRYVKHENFLYARARKPA